MKNALEAHDMLGGVNASNSGGGGHGSARVLIVRRAATQHATKTIRVNGNIKVYEVMSSVHSVQCKGIILSGQALQLIHDCNEILLRWAFNFFAVSCATILSCLASSLQV